MDAEAILSNLGLNDKEARTYLAILELGSSTIKPIADRAKIKRTSIYNFIDRLVEMGLVSRVNVRGRNRYEAQSPHRLLDLERHRFDLLERALPEFLGMFNRSATKPRISYYQGSEEVKNVVREEPRCKKEALYVWPGRDVMEMIGGAKFMTEIDRARIAKGVHIRTVRFREKDVPYTLSGYGPRYLRELRFAPPGFSVSMGLGIYDTGKVSFFSSRREGFGLMIESRELEELMRGLYEFLWARSIPAKLGEG